MKLVFAMIEGGLICLIYKERIRRYPRIVAECFTGKTSLLDHGVNCGRHLVHSKQPI